MVDPVRQPVAHGWVKARPGTMLGQWLGQWLGHATPLPSRVGPLYSSALVRALPFGRGLGGVCVGVC